MEDMRCEKETGNKNQETGGQGLSAKDKVQRTKDKEVKSKK
jgi:hypothetical protein